MRDIWGMKFKITAIFVGAALLLTMPTADASPEAGQRFARLLALQIAGSGLVRSSGSSPADIAASLP